MKRYFFKWLPVMLMAVMSVGLMSCGDDDNELDKDHGRSVDTQEKKKAEIIQNLRGYKWVGKSTDYDEYSYGSSTYKYTWILYFTSDHEGVMHYIGVEDDSYFGISRNEEHIDFTYTVNGTTIQLDGGSNFCFDYYGIYMMEGEDMYVPKEMESSDYEYLQEHKKGYHGIAGPLDSKVYIKDGEGVYLGSDYYNGKYSYLFRFTIGTEDENAYRKGMKEIKLTIWSDDASLSARYYFFGDQYKKFISFEPSEDAKEFSETVYYYSPYSEITLHYKLEYYNSTDEKWYSVQSKELTFVAN